jgi:hypothetical protein
MVEMVVIGQVMEYLLLIVLVLQVVLSLDQIITLIPIHHTLHLEVIDN